MELRRARLLCAVAGLAAALLAPTAAAGAGLPGKAVKVTAPRGGDRVVAYGRSQLLLIQPIPHSQPGITRINLDGSVDRSFGDEGTVEMVAEDAVASRDGEILVSTSSHPTGADRKSDARVTRLLPDGRLDPSFGKGGRADVDFGSRYDTGERVALTAGGKILLAGVGQDRAVVRGESSLSPALARLRPDGSLDRSFGKRGVRLLGGGGEIGVLDVAPTPDGGVVLEIGNEIESTLCKLGRDGSLDTGFGRRGWFELRGRREKFGYHEELFVTPQLAVLPSGKLLLAATGFPNRGPADWSRVVAVRLHRDGRIDRSYGKDGWAAASKGRVHTSADGLALLPGGVLAVATTFDSPPYERRKLGVIAFGPDGHPAGRFGRRGRCGAKLPGDHLVTGIAAFGRRAVVVGWGSGDWLLKCPPLRGR